MVTSPLTPLLQEMGARMGEAQGWELPLTFSTVDEEYESAHQGVALADRSYVGRIEASGKDALDLIHRLSTNHLLELSPGKGTTSVLTSSKGRILDWLIVLNQGDHLILLTGPQNQGKVIQSIEFYTFTEEASLKDITQETAMPCLIGPKALSLLQALSGKDLSHMELYSSETVTLAGVPLLIIRTDPVGLPGYDLILPADQALKVARVILKAGKPMGLVPMGEEALEVLRVEAGIPMYGKELSQAYNPLEASLVSSISYTKGCYVGQEVIARLTTYKKVQRRLTGIAFQGEELPPQGASLISQGKELGHITSVVRSRRLGKPLALGYIRLGDLGPGTQIEVKQDRKTLVGEVVELPLK